MQLCERYTLKSSVKNFDKILFIQIVQLNQLWKKLNIAIKRY